MKIRVKLKINGKVQGVSYRAEAQEKAQKLGLTGYAQNNRDGSVAVVLFGEELAVRQMITWCKGGPKAARVENVEINYEKEPSDTEVAPQSFEIY